MANINLIQQLRHQTGAGITDCKKALEESKNDLEKAKEILRKKGEKILKKRKDRKAKQGLIEAYIHPGGKIGAMVILSCETDFVSKSKEFKDLAHDLVMQVAAMDPLYLKPEEISEEVIEREKKFFQEQSRQEGKPDNIIDRIVEGRLEKFFEEVCLLKQKFIKDNSKTIKDLITEKITRLGEKIEVKRFVRFEI